MVSSFESPCLHCEWILPGVTCGSRRRSRCTRFLEYIQTLNRIKASRVLIGELKNLISK